MHINRLELKNYAGFSDFTLNFPKGNLTVLIGENGSGKTSILEAITALIRPYDEKFHEKGTSIPSPFAEETLHRNSNNEIIRPLNINIEIQANNEQLFAWEIVDSQQKYNDGNLQFYFSAKNDTKQYSLIEWEKLYAEIHNKEKKILLNIPFIFDKEINNFVTWYKNLYWYDAHMTKKYQRDYFPKIAVDKAVKAFSDLEIETVLGDTPDDIAFYFLKKGTRFTFSQLSEGERKMIGLIGTIINFFVPPFSEQNYDLLAFSGIVLIDEIETHLHPRWQKEILPNLCKTFPNVQFIVTTHSPFVIQSLKASELVDLNKTEVETDPFRLSIEEIAEEYQHVPDVERSKRFKEMVEVATEYFALIEQESTPENVQKAQNSKLRLDEIEMDYNDDPYFVALLQAERKTRFNQHLKV